MPGAFDLRRFAPPKGITVTLASGQAFEFPGDPDTDDVARMLRLEDELANSDGRDLADLIDEGKKLIEAQALQADPGQDVAAMRLGSGEMVVLFALLLHGETVAEAVASSLSPPADDTDTDDDPGAAEGESGPLAATPEPLASA